MPASPPTWVGPRDGFLPFVYSPLIMSPMCSTFFRRSLLVAGFCLSCLFAFVHAQEENLFEFLLPEEEAEEAPEPDEPGLESVPSDEVEAQEDDTETTEEPLGLGIAIADTVEVTGPTGIVSGVVVRQESGEPLVDVTVTIVDLNGFVAYTDDAGEYVFEAVPQGTYDVRFRKTGFRPGLVRGVVVEEGETTSVGIELPVAEAEDAFLLDEFEIEAEEASQFAINIQARLQADQLVDTFSGEDFARFIASDVAAAIQRIPGISVQEGQFAVIRGLEDRYSSVTLNGMPVPSPDPNRQSVQLDLFPSDIVSNLEAFKTFDPFLASNSAGGSLNIITAQFPQGDEVVGDVAVSVGFNDNALENFIEFRPGSAVGEDTSPRIENDISFFQSASWRYKDRRFGLFFIGAREVDQETSIGITDDRRASFGTISPFFPPPLDFLNGPEPILPLSEGILINSQGRFDTIQSQFERRATLMVGGRVGLDKEDTQRIFFNYFLTDFTRTQVELSENGAAPPDGQLTDIAAGGLSFISNSDIVEFIDEAGAELEDNFGESESFETDRDLSVFQVFGQHEFEPGNGEFNITWLYGRAQTTQSEENRVLGFFQDADTNLFTAPSTADVELPFNLFANDVEEELDIFRMEMERVYEVNERVTWTLKAGAYFERASRTTDSLSLLNAGTQTTSSAETLAEVEDFLFTVGGFVPELASVATESRGERDVQALGLSTKLTINRRLDFILGFRLENLEIDAINDPFAGDIDFEGIPVISPSRFVLFSPDPVSGITNADLIGIAVPFGGDVSQGFSADDLEDLVNGEIEETLFLPSLSVTFRPDEKTRMTVAYSRTTARPSFRELGYFISTNPSELEPVLGNPQLGLSDVQSVDFRIERAWGDGPNIVALSVFGKQIENPIERILLVDLLEGSSFVTFFNNPNTARLFGVEAELRHSLGIFSEALEYFTIGGNYTYIDAEVDNPDSIIDAYNDIAPAAAAPLRVVTFGDNPIPTTRRLFNQPEWIANGDITYDNPNWGTRMTLSVSAISDVLVAAGSAPALKVDRFTQSFYQLNFVFRQSIGRWTLGFSVSNLTDTKREIFNDPGIIGQGQLEESFRQGRDYSFSLSASF